MQNIPIAQMWHLSRGRQQRVVISDQELRLLAQSGRLRADDLVWKRGYEGWRTAFSVPGLLTPPPLPESDFQSDQFDKIHDAEKLETVQILGARFVGTVFAWFQDLSSLAKKLFRWLRYCQKVVGRQVSLLAVRAAAGSETFLSRLEHPRVLACLLAAAVGVETLDIAMQSSLADPARSSPKHQDQLIERAAASALSSPQKQAVVPEAATKPTLVDYGFSSFQSTMSNNLVEADESQAPARSSAQGPSPQEMAAVEAIPRPTRKPKKGTADTNNRNSERAHVAPKRLSQARTRSSGPKPMRFGTIGFNYPGPAM